MPCVMPMYDIAGVKFISRNVDDWKGFPVRNSHILLQSRKEWGLLAVVDGIWITNMRTGAVAAHSVIEYGKSNMKTLGIMGLGIAAWSFMYIFGSIYQESMEIKILRYKDQAEKFIERFKEELPHFRFQIVESIDEICSSDIVISSISYARNNIASTEIFQKGCTVVPIHTAGFQNCDLCFDRIIVDDFGHVKTYRYFEDFKDKAVEVADIEMGMALGRENDLQKIIVYCGGIAVHDLYFAYKILQLSERFDNVPVINMGFPKERLWV